MRAFKDFDSLLDEDAPTAPGDAVERPAVVVIDDDPAIRHALGALLGERYRVTLCASAREGVAAVGDEVCAVILDVKMQGYDGFWACDQLRKTYPELPVIFYSAYQDVKNPYDIINEHRPFAYLVKGSHVERLLDTLETAVGLRQVTLENKRLLEALLRERRQRPG